MNYGSSKVCLKESKQVEIDRDDLDSTPFAALSAESSEQQVVAPATTHAGAPGQGGKKKKKIRWKQSRGPVGGRSNAYQQQVDTSVVSIRLGTLGEKATTISTGDPLFCRNQKCKAVFSAISALLDEKKASTDPRCQGLKIETGSGVQVWICEFCFTPQIVELDEEERPTGEAVDYILAPPEEKAVSEEDEKQVVFVIDTSGSMCVTQEVEGHLKLKGLKQRRDEFEHLLEDGDDRSGLYQAGRMQFGRRGQRTAQKTYVSRLQCVQAAVDSQVEALSQRHPNNKVAIMTFNNDVTIYGDCTEEPTHCAGDKLGSKDALSTIGQTYNIKNKVEHSKDSIRKKIFDLKENGQTCLGPALLLAVHVASQKRGSQVILCTDGLANVGLGALEGQGAEAAAEFYDELAREAARQGVMVSTVSITDQEASLENLGLVADATGGAVDRIDPLKLSENFTGILENAVLAIQSQATMLLHHGLVFRGVEEQEQESSKKGREEESAQMVHRLTKDVGNVFADSEIFFEYSVHKDVKKRTEGLKAIPFQVQIQYTRLDGSKCVRVITHTREITYDEEEVLQDMNHAVLAANCIQRSACLAQQGDYEASRLNNVAWGHFMNSSPSKHRQQQQDVLRAWSAQAEQLDSMLQREQHTETVSGMNMRSMDRASRRRVRSSKRSDSISSAMYKSKHLSSRAYTSPSSQSPAFERRGGRGGAGAAAATGGGGGRGAPCGARQQQTAAQGQAPAQSSRRGSGGTGWLDWLNPMGSSPQPDRNDDEQQDD